MDIIADGPILWLSGDLTGRSTADVRATIHHHMGRHGARAVIDVREVAAVDMTALRMVAAAGCRTGQRVRLRGASTSTRRLLHLSRLHRFFRVEASPIGA